MDSLKVDCLTHLIYAEKDFSTFIVVVIIIIVVIVVIIVVNPHQRPSNDRNNKEMKKEIAFVLCNTH